MHITRCYKRLKLRRLRIALIAVVISLFFIPNFAKYEKGSDNMFALSINGKYVGCLNSLEKANECLLKARKNVNSRSEELTLADVNMTYEGSNVNFGRVDLEKSVIANMENEIINCTNTSLKKAYEVKIKGYIVNLESKIDVLTMLQAPIDKYDKSNHFIVTLNNDEIRELPVLTPVVGTMEEIEENAESTYAQLRSAGFDAEMDELYKSIEPDVEIALEDYELGIVSMDFGDTIEVVEVYVNKNDLDNLNEAIEEVTKEEAQNEVYKVQSGDALSTIAVKVGVPMEDLIAMNDSLEDQFSKIYPDQEIIYAVPEPKLSIVRDEVIYTEENYDLPIEYEYRDDWFTSDTEVLIQPSAGFRRAVATVSYRNDKSVSEDIVAEDIIYQAVAKKVMKGTKIPPTYVKPIYGGRLSSTFGHRSRPTKGASSYHKGVDWATPVGTPVMASSGGVVAKAGWGSGYGNVIYINHPDGTQTRYGHLSKILVSQGQSVSQGQKIALSGNTGVSTGPHIHFEILKGGSQVNPLKYIG